MVADIKKFYGGSQNTLKKINFSVVLDRLRNGSNISKTSLSKELNISLPTISRIIDSLVKQKYAEVGGLGESKKGKKPIYYKFNSKRSYVIGVNVDIDFLQIVISDLSGNLINNIYIEHDFSSRQKELINEICNQISNIIDQTDIDEKKIEIVCVGVPAVVKPKTGVISLCPSIPEWADIRLGRAIELKTGIKTLVDNINYLSLLGETWKGCAINLKNVIFLGVTTGISAGILIDGKIYRGADNTAGEIGSMLIDPNINIKQSHPYGQFESIVSNTYLLDIVNKHNLFSEGKAHLTKDLISNLLKNEDLKKIVLEMQDNMAYGISNLISILNPELIILKGKIYENKYIFDYLKNKISQLTKFKNKIELSKLKEDSVIIGAIKHGVNYIDDKTLSPFFRGSS